MLRGHRRSRGVREALPRKVSGRFDRCKTSLTFAVAARSVNFYIGFPAPTHLGQELGSA